MVEIVKNIDQEVTDALSNAREVWVAVAMMNNGGLRHFRNLSSDIIQHHLIGIDLPTPHKILEELRELCSDTFSAKVRETKYYFHPKTYIVKDNKGNYTAFAGSSNATNGGFINNIELNIKITDNKSCLELIKWYWQVDKEAMLITDELIDKQRIRLKKIKKHQEEEEKERANLKLAIHRNDGQFFSAEHHGVFKEKYQRIRSKEITKVRKDVRNKFIELHDRIWPKFEDLGFTELYKPARGQEQTSRHYPSRFSGLNIGAIWLHYGKSPAQLSNYPKKDKQNSFMNHVRMQVIIHEDDVGIWLVLGKDHGSRADRKAFRDRMSKLEIKRKFYDSLKTLSPECRIRGTKWYVNREIALKDIDEILAIEADHEYFIIEEKFVPLDKSISDENMAKTVMEIFSKFYPVYELMNAEIHIS